MWRWLGGAVLGCIVGLALGWWSTGAPPLAEPSPPAEPGPDPDPELRADPPLQPVPIAPAARAPEPPSDCDEVRTELAWTQQQLETALDAHAEWPRDVQEQEHPTEVRRRVRAWVDQNPGFRLQTLDCDAYPCVAELRGPLEDADPKDLAISLVPTLGQGHLMLVEPHDGSDERIVYKAVQDSRDEDRVTRGAKRVQDASMAPVFHPEEAAGGDE